MTNTLMLDSSLGSAWDFGSVFTALETPSPKRVSKHLPEQTPSEKISPSPSRTVSYDDDTTPKPTPSIEISPALGDFGLALSYLGYTVSVTAPVSHPDDQDLALYELADNNALSESWIQRAHSDTDSDAIKHDSDSTETGLSKAAIKRAENGRRAVLDSYLGSSPENGFNLENKQKTQKSKSSVTWRDSGLSPSTVTPKTVTRSRKQASMNNAAEKKVQLILELHKRFSDDLVSLSNISTICRDADPQGIHCFVDISNILIGFHDTLKRNRQLNKTSRIPRQTLSFHNLSIILERGRPTAKRFLAGSDDIDCTQEARLLGYTTHILQRVEKPDYTTLPGTRRGKRSGLTSSDTDSGTPGRTKRAEQAVDEVLHLGMLQSLVDTDVPSTLVLASGDAAKAEFSDGFLKQVERALLKGWKVEVIAFRATTGFAYRDPNWTSRWGKSFRLIPLDDFAELLHVQYEGSNF